MEGFSCHPLRWHRKLVGEGWGSKLEFCFGHGKSEMSNHEDVRENTGYEFKFPSQVGDVNLGPVRTSMPFQILRLGKVTKGAVCGERTKS